MRKCVKFTFANKIEAMRERSLDSVKVEPGSTSRLSSAIFILPLFYLHDLNLRALMFILFICNVIHAFDLYTQPCGRKFAECVNAEGINVINYLKYNKVLNVITISFGTFPYALCNLTFTILHTSFLLKKFTAKTVDEEKKSNQLKY